MVRLMWWNRCFPLLISGAPTGSLAHIAPFSARGPTSDGRFKPDIAAPGTWVVSAAAQGLEAQHGLRYRAMNGTSAAAAATAGSLALLYQQQVMNRGAQPVDFFPLPLVTNTARLDRTTCAVDTGRNTWGAGKLDVVTAHQMLQANQDLPAITDLVITPGDRGGLARRFRVLASSANGSSTTLWQFGVSGVTDAVTQNTCRRTYVRSSAHGDRKGHRS